MLALLFGLLAGILGGVLAHKFIRFGILLTSLLSSFCIAFLIYGMVIYFVPLLQNFYGILGVTSVLFIIQICCLFSNGKILIILGTSSIGSYMFMRGWSIIFSKYPSEIETWQQLYQEELVEFQWQFLMYFSIFISWLMLSILVQSINRDHAWVKQALDLE